MDTVKMFVNGEAMTGGRLAPNLSNGRLFGPATTATRYRFLSVRDEFPALLPVDHHGVSVEGELYEVSYADLRELLLPKEPEELELTLIELLNGSGSLCMRLRADCMSLPGLVDISHFASWARYLVYTRGEAR